jgi:hypothetical protein
MNLSKLSFKDSLKIVFIWFPIGFVGLFALVYLIALLTKPKDEVTSQLSPSFQEKSSQSTDTQWRENESKQVKRQEMIQKLLNRGVFRKVEYWESGATVIVDSNFYVLDFDTKSSFVNVVYAYITTKTHTDPDFTGVILKDALSGKEVGSCGINGLEMK